MQDFFVHHQPVFQFLEHCLAIFGGFKALEIVIPWARGYVRQNWHTLGIALCIGLIAYAAIVGDAWGRGYNYGYTPKIKGTDKEAYVYRPKRSSYRRSETLSPAPSPGHTESRRDTASDIDYEIRALEILLGAYDKPKTTRPSEYVSLDTLQIKEPAPDKKAVTFALASMSPEPVPPEVSPAPSETAWKTCVLWGLYTIGALALVMMVLAVALLVGPDLCHIAWDRLREFCQQIPATMPMPSHWLPLGVVRSVAVSMISLPIIHGICWALDMDSGIIISTGMVGAGVYALTGEVPR